MPTPVAQQDATAALDSERSALEAYALTSLKAGLERKALSDALRAQFGPFSAQLEDALAQADADLTVYAKAIAGLTDGTAELVRWRKGEGGAIKWGVHKVGTTLGLWPLVIAIVVVTGALTGAAWLLLDTFGSAQKIEAQAELLRQQTLAEAQARAKQVRAQGEVGVANAMDLAIAQAAKNAKQPQQSLFDRIIGRAEDAGAGAAFGGVTALAALYFISRSRSKRKSKRS